jgi:hypothetical protein
VRAAADPDLAGVSGRFLGPTGELMQPSAATRDRTLAERLWDISERLVGLDPAGAPPTPAASGVTDGRASAR